MFIDTIIKDPEEVLPRDLLKDIEKLDHGDSNLIQSVITQIHNLQNNEIKIYALILIHDMDTISLKTKQKVFIDFINDSYCDIRYHMVLFAGLYHIKESIPILLELSATDTNALVRSTIFWSLVKFNIQEGLLEKISHELQEPKDDLSLSFLAASLYLLNNKKDSAEMLLLKDFFLKNFFNKKKHQFTEAVQQSIDFSPEFISHLLWKAGYDFPRIATWQILELDWLISKE